MESEDLFYDSDSSSFENRLQLKTCDSTDSDSTTLILGLIPMCISNSINLAYFHVDILQSFSILLFCRFFDIPFSVLPEIRSSSEIYGYLTSGSLRGVPISGLLGDQQAALVGQMCLSKGQAKNTYGTGCFLLKNTGNQVANLCQVSLCFLVNLLYY